MFSVILLFFYAVFAILGLYALILLIKVLTRAIEALDIYLDEKRNRRL
jgi:hypothetical protein